MRGRNISSAIASLAVAVVIPLLVATPASAVAPVASAANIFPLVPSGTAPIGDIVITEDATGDLPVGDIITLRIVDAANGSKLHLVSTPVVGATNGLNASVTTTSSSGTLNDEVLVTVDTPSAGVYPGALTVAGLRVSVDSSVAYGKGGVWVSDSSGVIAPPGSPIKVLDANGIGTDLKATYSSVSKPTLTSTGAGQSSGGLTISEPAKVFFQTGDVITFSIRDSLGSADTIGLDADPTASGGGMLVHVSGLTGGPVQQNDSGFKVVVDASDPSNGSASTITLANLVYNTAKAPVGPVTISAVVTTGAPTEHIYPGRVVNATVGGATTTQSSGKPIVPTGATAQTAANITIKETPGTLKPGDSFSLAMQEPGVTFSAAPVATVTDGNILLGMSSATLDVGKTTATWTVTTSSTVTSYVVIGPIFYDVAADGAGATAGHTVSVRASGSAGSAFTSDTVVNALLAPTNTTLFTATSSPATPEAAGDVTYQEAGSSFAPTSGSIVLLAPYATQIAAYRTTFAQVPVASVTPGSGLVLGTPTVNNATITVTTADGKVNAPPQTAAIFPVSAGSTSPATVTFSSISYVLGSYVPPGALVAAAAVDTGASGTGTNVSGNQFVNALVSTGSLPVYRPDGMIKVSTASAYLGNDIYSTTAAGQTVAVKAARGTKKTFLIQVQNDGNSLDQLAIKGAGAQKGFTITYLLGANGTTSITSQVIAGSYTTIALAPGGTTVFRAVIGVKATATIGTVKAFLVTAASAHDASVTDVVRASVKAR